MLKISREQFDALERNARKRFHKDIYDRLWGLHCRPIQTMPETQVLEHMAIWHERGLSFGIESERTMGRYLGLHLTVLPDFDRQDAVYRFLSRSDLSGDQKMTALYTRLRRREGIH
ncbi:hypothetical protein [Candidatus Thiosymbion oneisti]|uniref:hypothetical protein n=1 Tax=Candidatus Thiosymbion oneisti TaxID=589554 RepID=UPI00105BDB23|nr:hypothetical protein [Candidatus Thiosymbion oneisti]